MGGGGSGTVRSSEGGLGGRQQRALGGGERRSGQGWHAGVWYGEKEKQACGPRLEDDWWVGCFGLA
jgi:hypothetical protein